MSLKERITSVLVVSASEAFHTALSGLLSPSCYQPVVYVQSISAARRACTEREFDFVLINAPLPDDMGTRFAIDTVRERESVVLLLVRSELHDEIHEKVVPYGVFTLPKPTSKNTLLTALSWMESARERLRMYPQKTLSMAEKMEEIRLVNRAKWILIDQLGMAEPEAHRTIEKKAMDHCVSKREIAEEIIRLHEKQA